MLNNRFAGACFFLAIIAALPGHSFRPQSITNPQRAPSPKEFFERLVEYDVPSALPKYEDLLKVVDQIPDARPEDLAKALPAIFAALGHRDDDVKKYAALALFVVSRRSDGAELLKKYIPRINEMFESSNERLQGMPTAIYMNLRPVPPEALPSLLAFLKRTDRDTGVQAGAVFTLVHLAPQDPEVAAAIGEFLSRPMESSSRIGVLNALGDPGVQDAHIIAMVITYLDDPDEGIRSTAVQALTRMGPHALRQAEPALQRLAQDPKQPAEVTAFVKEALRQIHPPHN